MEQKSGVGRNMTAELGVHHEQHHWPEPVIDIQSAYFYGFLIHLSIPGPSCLRDCLVIPLHCFRRRPICLRFSLARLSRKSEASNAVYPRPQNRPRGTCCMARTFVPWGTATRAYLRGVSLPWLGGLLARKGWFEQESAEASDTQKRSYTEPPFGVPGRPPGSPYKVLFFFLSFSLELQGVSPGVPRSPHGVPKDNIANPVLKSYQRPYFKTRLGSRILKTLEGVQESEGFLIFSSSRGLFGSPIRPRDGSRTPPGPSLYSFPLAQPQLFFRGFEPRFVPVRNKYTLNH